MKIKGGEKKNEKNRKFLKFIPTHPIGYYRLLVIENKPGGIGKVENFDNLLFKRLIFAERARTENKNLFSQRRIAMTKTRKQNLITEAFACCRRCTISAMISSTIEDAGQIADADIFTATKLLNRIIERGISIRDIFGGDAMCEYLSGVGTLFGIDAPETLFTDEALDYYRSELSLSRIRQ